MKATRVTNIVVKNDKGEVIFQSERGTISFREIKKAPPTPKCCVCKTTQNLHRDGWRGYRCDKTECMVF